MARMSIVIDIKPTGSAYRWRCSCGKQGEWRYGGNRGSIDSAAVRSARNGGARHVAAMERGR